MGFEITTLGPGICAGFDEVIDVRSPAEFAEDHIPGAINLPAFSNEERARVGTLYVQVSAFDARKLGAALLARRVAEHLEGPLAGKDGSWKPLVYCWRGGQRSGGVTTILSQIGWRAERVAGGYQSYRRRVVDLLYKAALPHKVLLLDGNTGSGKTAILTELARRGHQVLDLEGLANHKGSLLGGALAPQPAQKMFESLIAQKLASFDPDKVVIMEAESSKIGACLVPTSLWKVMKSAPRVHVDAPLDARAAFLVEDYADILSQTGAMEARLEDLRALCSAETVGRWVQDLRAKRFSALAKDIMRVHYDPAYTRSRAKQSPVLLATVRAQELDAAGIASLADQVVSVMAQASPVTSD